MRILATVALSFLALGCTAAVTTALPSDTLRLRTGGAPFEAQFIVELSASGLLQARRFGPPHVVSREVELHLSTTQAAELLSLASQSIDFSAGCGQVADGTAATMSVTYSGAQQSFSCSGAPKWPIGSNTKAFLSTLNEQLPGDLQVF